MKVFYPSSALAFASFAGVVQAHGYLSQPAATYTASTVEGVYYTGFNAVTDASINSGFDGGTYNSSPELNAQSFTDHWNATGYSSLREMLDPIAPDYGLSSATATPVDVSSFTEMWWQNNEYQQGFLPSHHASTTSTAGEASYAADITPEATTAAPEVTTTATDATTTAEEDTTTTPEATEDAKCNRRKL
ncbi:hypothetical protein BBJ28_00014369 [Nothophytophthora sp. Chile5]|nr:hypothetical protein BBJ28_00014369 [Nothophytophthora sp. Chile5]